ncbi:M48 family metallopeptidase [Desulforhopalus singaporensis]|uniref:STE24 endopeptidase n=1 Tax=Desulforhopalus singaporensis TaxID=91360 RepID=A0A1H0V4R5_9BACT|nr:M48 family metallopeptidase [Desulforhopalus singaporensis]SDP73364.1 STE24 endopeptidase [Desulforhopalus singaporensis]
MNVWLVAVVLILLGSFILETTVAVLNIRALVPTLPDHFKSIYEQSEYSRSQAYTRSTTRLGIVENCWSTSLTLLFLLFGGFNVIDIWARALDLGEIATGLIFGGVLVLLVSAAALPFSVYATFVIEERYGFNRTTVRTYMLDLIKTALLSIVIGAPLFGGIIWFFSATGQYGWVYCWIGVCCFSLLVQYLAPVLIMPLFNKFTPLEQGELRNKIEKYLEQEDFYIQGIFTMDGSKRSSKLNAFFTGFGRFRKIVFYDTLIEKLDDEEIVAVLAHEMGHFKLDHIQKMMAATIVQTGIMFYLLSLFLTVPEVAYAFKMEHPSVYSSLIFFGFLYSPVNIGVSVAFNIFSRKHEYEADHYGATSTKSPDFLISGLKKLSKANLSNLTPHPLNVFIHYSHPPVLQRITKLEGHR